MIITKSSLPRRTVLRGLGSALMLPFLDAMMPALSAQSKTAAKPVRRLSVIYLPNGMAMDYWTPKTGGSELALSPTLQPLAAFRDQLTLLSGLNQIPANPLFGEGTGDHARAGAVYLTGVHPKKTAGTDIRAGVSMDQIVAKEFKKETQLASLELALDSTESAGACDGDYSCAYVNTISWITPTTPLPTETNPRLVFERLFGEGASTDPKSKLARMEQDRSILDTLKESVSRLKSDLGPHDSGKLADYLDAIRDVERRIQLAEAQGTREFPVLNRPAGVPETFEAHAKLMFDLQVLAFQADMTRVITHMMGREVSNRAYPEIGVTEPHHPLSHHQDDPARIAKLAKVNQYHASMFAHYLEKLRSTPDGDGSLLDHTMILYGAGISNSNLHIHTNLPILVAGGSGAGIKGGRHLTFPEGTPLTNLHLTLLNKLGIPAEKIGDSTGVFQELSAV
jgi:hypothetical protein